MEKTLDNTIPTNKESDNAAPVAQSSRDLSAEIIATVKKEKFERVTCRRIVGDHYRVNWWRPEGLESYDNPAMQGLMVTTNRICKSWFVQVRPTTSGKLEMIVR